MKRTEKMAESNTSEETGKDVLSREVDALDRLFAAANEMTVEGCDEALRLLPAAKEAIAHTQEATAHEVAVLEKEKEVLGQKHRAGKSAMSRQEKKVRKVLAQKRFAIKQLHLAVEAAMKKHFLEDSIRASLVGKIVVFNTREGLAEAEIEDFRIYQDRPEIRIKGIEGWVRVHPVTLAQALSEEAILEEKVTGKGEVELEDLLRFVSENRSKGDDYIRRELKGARVTKMHNSITIDDYKDGDVHVKGWHKRVWVPVGEHPLRAALLLDKDMKMIEKAIRASEPFGMKDLAAVLEGKDERGRELSEVEWEEQFPVFFDGKVRDVIRKKVPLARRFFKCKT